MAPFNCQVIGARNNSHISIQCQIWHMSHPFPLQMLIFGTQCRKFGSNVLSPFDLWHHNGWRVWLCLSGDTIAHKSLGQRKPHVSIGERGGWGVGRSLIVLVFKAEHFWANLGENDFFKFATLSSSSWLFCQLTNGSLGIVNNKQIRPTLAQSTIWHGSTLLGWPLANSHIHRSSIRTRPFETQFL